MIIISMAGLSSRFFKAGYQIPKYQLPLHEKTVFYYAINSFEKYFQTEKFVFVVRDIFNTPTFVQDEAKKLGIIDFDICILNEETRGQAESVYLATKKYDNDFPIIIFNIDTFRYHYEKPIFINECDGYLEVFSAEGEHWSFVLPGEDQKVIRTTEKDRISDLCSDGLYYFKSKRQFETIFLDAVDKNESTKGEYYIAPLYNRLIMQGGIVKYQKISLEEIDFCGTPDEYLVVQKTLKLKN